MNTKNLLSVAVSAIFVLLALGSGEGSDGGSTSAGTAEVAEAKPENIVSVDLSTLLADYENNEVGADLKYKGKVLKVTGKVGDIKKDILDNIYVTVGTGKQFEIPTVQAFFTDKHTGKAASLSKGQDITIQGRCEGLMMNVLIKDSIIVAGAGGGGAAAEVAKPKAVGGVVSVDLSTLLADYENNEVGADVKYKDKVLKVTGKVGDIKKDILDNIYVTVGTGKQFEIPVVQAFFTDEHTSKAATLSKGQRITVQGKCEGLMMNVLIKDAIFID